MNIKKKKKNKKIHEEMSKHVSIIVSCWIHFSIITSHSQYPAGEQQITGNAGSK